MIRAHVRSGIGWEVAVVIALHPDDESAPTRVLRFAPGGTSGTWQWDEVDRYAAVEPTFTLPEAEARALLDGLARFYEGTEDTRALRRDYDAERKRVDDLTRSLTSLTHALAARTPYGTDPLLTFHGDQNCTGHIPRQQRRGVALVPRRGREAAMTTIAYDCEFLEDGSTIDLISIGLVCEDGREYYAVNAEMPVKRIFAHKWLMANVAPSLPLRDTHSEQLIRVDACRTEVKPRQVIANEVRDFILSTPRRELWADYGAYDHVVLCQLWGSMVNLPEGIPMWTHDLRQEMERHGNPEVPALDGAEHNAMHDAREVLFRLRWLREHAGL